MKRILTTIIFAATLASSIVFAAKEPKLSATSAILVEASTGRILYERNANEELPPASTIKFFRELIG